jgi:hypothetical protein
LDYEQYIEISDIAYDSTTDTLLAYDFRSAALVSIDRTNGAGSVLANADRPVSRPALAIDSSGNIFSAGYGDILAYDPSFEGFLSTFHTGEDADSLTIDKNTGTFYGTRGIDVWSFNELTGTHHVWTRSDGFAMNMVAFDSYSNTLYGSDGRGLFIIDTITGDAELVTHFDNPIRIRSMAFAPSVVPIPAAVWLFGSALAGLGWMRRKQTV